MNIYTGFRARPGLDEMIPYLFMATKKLLWFVLSKGLVSLQSRPSVNG